MARYEHTGANTDWHGFGSGFYTGGSSSSSSVSIRNTSQNSAAANSEPEGHYVRRWTGSGYSFEWRPGPAPAAGQEEDSNANLAGTVTKSALLGVAIGVAAFFLTGGKKG